jgi:hypothetical protein
MHNTARDDLDDEGTALFNAYHEQLAAQGAFEESDITLLEAAVRMRMCVRVARVAADAEPVVEGSRGLGDAPPLRDRASPPARSPDRTCCHRQGHRTGSRTAGARDRDAGVAPVCASAVAYT